MNEIVPVQLGFATLGWVRWHNTQGIRGYFDGIPPAEVEQAFCADQRITSQLMETT
jgi:hypothetical protein